MWLYWLQLFFFESAQREREREGGYINKYSYLSATMWLLNNCGFCVIKKDSEEGVNVCTYIINF